MHKIKYLRDINKLTTISEADKIELAKVAERYSFRANDYYLGLIDWSNPNGPIRKIVIPQTGELQEFGDLDASSEETNYVTPGCQHKYPHTVLLLCTEICGAYCRFCFRKRLFMYDNDEASVDINPGLEYIRNNSEVTNVLLTGGDPLFLSTRRLRDIISQLRDIPHVGIIRIGSKMPAFNPYRIIDDPELLEMFSEYSQPDKRIYMMTHFNVPQELTTQAKQSLSMLLKAGVILANQSPILKGINDDPQTLATLMTQLSMAGVPSYYFFQCRPTAGNKPFELPLVESYQIISEAWKHVSGLEKRARLVMSHESGKVEMVGLTDEHIYLKYHRARNPIDEGQLFIYHRDDRAYWLDDLVSVDKSADRVTA